jgi:hypothetical protein
MDVRGDTLQPTTGTFLPATGIRLTPFTHCFVIQHMALVQQTHAYAVTSSHWWWTIRVFAHISTYRWPFAPQASQPASHLPWQVRPIIPTFQNI